MKREKSKRRIMLNARPGLFAVLNCAVHAFSLCDERRWWGMPTWSSKLYGNGVRDCWDDYFVRINHTAQEAIAADQFLPVPPEFIYKRRRKHAIAAPRGRRLPRSIDNLVDNSGFTSPLMLPPMDRRKCARIISHYMNPSDRVVEALVKYKMAVGWEDRDVIGLHIRSKEATDSGVPLMCEYLGRGNPPYPLFFEEVDMRLEKYPDSSIFLGTDGYEVQLEVKKRYGTRVMTRVSDLPIRGAHRVSGPVRERIGLDALVDILLLRETYFFVHGNSNASNFVLASNHLLPHYDVFGHLYDLEWLNEEQMRLQVGEDEQAVEG